MRPSEALANHRAKIRRVVEARRARNPRAFGSVVHGDDTEDSDLDILIDPTPETTLMDVAAIQVELERLLGISVEGATREVPQRGSYRGGIGMSLEEKVK